MMHNNPLTLEHFHWQNNAGVDQRRLKIRKAMTNWKMFLLDPAIASDHFEFTFKIHSYSGLTDNFCIGICEPNHPTEQTGKNQGWWNESNTFAFPEKKNPFHNVDTSGILKSVGVVVNKKQKTLEFRRNGKNLRRKDKVFVNIGFPDVLHIAIAPRKKVDVELVKFKDYSPKQPMMMPGNMMMVNPQLLQMNLIQQQQQQQQQLLLQQQQPQMNMMPPQPMMMGQPQNPPVMVPQQQQPISDFKNMVPVSNAPTFKGMGDLEDKEQIKRRIMELERELLMLKQKLQHIESREKVQYGNVY